MGIAKLYGQKASGIDINGIIKDYYAYAGENISAGDLVEFINGVASSTTETSTLATLNGTKYTGYPIKSLKLDENRVFITHGVSNSMADECYLYGMVVTIEGATITVGTDMRLSTETLTGYRVSLQLLENGNIFIAHAYSTKYYLNAMLLTVNGTTIEIIQTNTTTISAVSMASYSFSTELLKDGKIFVAHCYNTNYYLYGTVVTIDGTTITIGTSTALRTDYASGYEIISTTLSTQEIFIAHSYSNNYYLWGTICSITGTTISINSSAALYSSNNAGRALALVNLGEDRVFITHSDSSKYTSARVFSISGTTIKSGTLVQINATQNYYLLAPSPVLLERNKVCVSHCGDSTSFFLYAAFCTIDGTTITVEKNTVLSTESRSGEAISTLLLAKDIVLLTHSNTTYHYLTAQVFGVNEENNVLTNNVTINEYETQVRKTTTSQFDGVAKEVVLGKESPVLKQGDIIPNSWTQLSTLEWVAENGTKITASGADNPVNFAVDGNTSTAWFYQSEVDNNFLTLEFPQAIKIMKMKTYIKSSNGFSNAKIQGSNDNATWVDLYTMTSPQTMLTEIQLTNIDYYKYYRVGIWVLSVNYASQVYELQTSEYETIEKGKDLVSIYTLPQYEYVEFTSNPAPTSWTNGEDGLTATATNDYGEWSLRTTKGPWTTGTNLGVIADGSTSTVWDFEKFSSDSEVAYMYLTPPTGVEINPTSIYVYNNMCSSSSDNSSHRSKLQGYDGSNWIDLGTLNSGTAGVEQTFTISGDTFFTEFRLAIYRFSSTYPKPYIFEFQIRSGTFRIMKN